MNIFRYLLLFVLICDAGYMFSLGINRNNEKNGAERDDSDEEMTESDFDLFSALEIEDLKEIENIINPVYVNLINEAGESLLTKAVRKGNREIIDILIKAGADINFQNNAGFNALILASNKGDSDIVKILTDSNANLNLQNKNGDTALIRAAQIGQDIRNKENSGRLEIIRILADHKCNLDIQNNDGDTALIAAIKNSLNERANLLIRSGANFNLKDNNGYTALMYAVINNNLDLVNIFLNSGAMLAIKNNIILKNNNNENSLDLAKNNQEIYNILFNKLNEINAIKKALFEAIYNGDYTKTIELMKKIGLQIYDEKGNNPLHIAVIAKDSPKKLDIFKIIFSINPNLAYQKNNNYQNPIDLSFNSPEILKLFISIGGNTENINSKKRKDRSFY